MAPAEARAMSEPQETPVDAAPPAEVAPAQAEARRARRRRAMGGVVALARTRLKRAAGARVALLLAVVVTIVFATSALVVRGTDGAEAPVASVVGRAAQWLLWLAGAPLALSIARRRPLEDRADGIEALAASRGFSTQALESARVLSAITPSSLLLGVPLVALAALVVALAGSARIALARAPLLAGAPLFAIVAGGTLARARHRVRASPAARAGACSCARSSSCRGCSAPSSGTRRGRSRARSTRSAPSRCRGRSRPSARRARSCRDRARRARGAARERRCRAAGQAARAAPRRPPCSGAGVYAVLGAPEDGTLALRQRALGRAQAERAAA